VRELQSGLWYWEARHPEWTPSAPWSADVSSYAIDDGEHLLLFDPLGVPSELVELAAERSPLVVLTSPWHERDTRSLVEQLGAPVFLPPLDPEQAAGGTPDAAWLLAGNGREAHLYTAGDRIASRIEAFPGREHNDLVLWVEDRNAVIPGDTLVDFGRGLEIPTQWLPEGVTREQVADGLRRLLALPVELVLPTHGPPTDRAALERSLS
jgi:glyoxylase-like metal-dependent hydrolase (beta-lactamase superfamily II)